MKRHNDGRLDGRGPPPKRGRGPVSAGTCAFKVLCPDQLVSGVLGPNGQSVRQIQDSSGCHCNFSRRNEYYPNSNLRILVITGATAEEIMTCLDLVLDQVVACCEEERQKLESEGKLGEQDGDFIDVAGDIRVCIAITESAAKGGCDGPDGITRMQEVVGVRLYLEESVHDEHQLVVMAGTREQLQEGLQYFNNLVQAQVQESWFAAWADKTSFWEPGRGGSWSNEALSTGGKPPPDPANSKHRNILFIGGLSQQTDIESLANYFAQYGEILETDVKRDQQSGRSKGFGFVTFASEEPAEACIADMKAHVIDGKTVDVKRYGFSTPPGRSRDGPPQGQRPAPAPREIIRPTSFSESFRDLPSRGNTSGWSGHSGPATHDHYEPAPVRNYSVADDVRWFGGLAETVPPQYLDQDYCITCSLPNAQCGALIGRGGENINEVERKTGTRVQLTKKEENSDHRTLSIIGPLISVYAAHLLVMRNFNEALHRPDPKERQVEELQKQIAVLTQQVDSVRSGRRR
ncbi:unnamed protein product [Durusdinium trenchii]|uniref:Uncharacterized protein n=3 Tax=Durusdinium trenchii TaxID=1381693 RepID=A0ABP0LE86_9DINO